MRTVLITGARAPVALDLARAFAAAGYDPHLVDSIHPWGARLSRVGRGRLHQVAKPRFDFAGFRADLGQLIARLDPILIVPTCEEVFHLAEACRQLGVSDRLFAPPPEMLRRLHSKVEFAALARGCEVDAPETERITSRMGLDRWRARAGELVFKPEYSRFGSHVLVRPQPARLDRLEPTLEAPWAVQPFVAGEEVSIWSAARAGEIVAFAGYRPIWRVGRSAGFYFERDQDPALLAVAQRIAATTCATGQLSFDLIRRPDGSLCVLECNPRAVSGVHLFDADPALARAMLGESRLQLPDATARHLGPAMWLIGLPQALLGGRLVDWRRDLIRSQDALAQAGEPWTRIGAVLDAARFAAIGLSRARSAAGQSTDDIEWNGEPIR